MILQFAFAHLVHVLGDLDIEEIDLDLLPATIRPRHGYRMEVIPTRPCHNLGETVPLSSAYSFGFVGRSSPCFTRQPSLVPWLLKSNSRSGLTPDAGYKLANLAGRT